MSVTGDLIVRDSQRRTDKIERVKMDPVRLKTVHFVPMGHFLEMCVI